MKDGLPDMVGSLSFCSFLFDVSSVSLLNIEP